MNAMNGGVKCPQWAQFALSSGISPPHVCLRVSRSSVTHTGARMGWVWTTGSLQSRIWVSRTPAALSRGRGKQTRAYKMEKLERTRVRATCHFPCPQRVIWIFFSRVFLFVFFDSTKSKKAQLFAFIGHVFDVWYNGSRGSGVLWLSSNGFM